MPVSLRIKHDQRPANNAGFLSMEIGLQINMRKAVLFLNTEPYTRSDLELRQEFCNFLELG